ncbi:hypothetical protein C449_01970 [Halococcus saccharolyticus DSM 5350]|uniref:Sulfatase N-terminal domain-containing protein n=1 Tax=Halococcus saccharolyticus DSM 5350 TaxID=1227455 RepID=M0MPP4_9EURY|nr:hypothetical protein [Halococcus saccharolyticus]EMA47333.1 hypothetical protein C449_01970 [Halococcus saccharolyticus DSM 5350]
MGYGDDGIAVFDQDWDVLIILDACRYNAYKKHASLPGDLRAVTSQGSVTPEWIRKNVGGRDLTDTVFVSANGRYLKLADELNARWHAFEPVVEDELADAEKSLLVAPPKAVTEQARVALEQYPRKRIVIHYVQPHTPYLGPLGREHFEPGRNLQDLSTDPTLDRDLILDAYHENLELVLSSVEELLDTAGPDIGRVVVTSDHGELLGDRLWPLPVRQWGHIPDLHHPLLVRVPWHRLDVGARRDVIAEEPADEAMTDEGNEQERLTEHLRALGYAE